MHSSHHSRGRILFDAFCALTVSASLAAAWMQTGASALLSAAGVAALYGLVHAFDWRRGAAEPAEPQLIDVPREAQGVHLAYDVAQAEPSRVSEPEKPQASQERSDSRAKARPKAGGRRGGAPKKAKVAEIAPAPKAEPALPAPAEEPVHIEPLFEPEPFVRMPRPAFGRKAG